MGLVAPADHQRGPTGGTTGIRTCAGTATRFDRRKGRPRRHGNSNSGRRVKRFIRSRRGARRKVVARRPGTRCAPDGSGANGVVAAHTEPAKLGVISLTKQKLTAA